MTSLVPDEEAARHFCRTYLLPYKNPHILNLAARKKYSNDTMSKPVVILERIVLSFDKEMESEDLFIQELKKMNILANAGFYTEPERSSKARGKGGGGGGAIGIENPSLNGDGSSTKMILKSEWMVPYITAFGLDEDDAADAFVQKVMDTRKEQRRMLLVEKSKQTKKTSNTRTPCMSNITSKMKSLLHQHPSNDYRWLKLDVDTKQSDLILELQQSLMGGTILYAAETRGGYHVVLEKGPCCKSLYTFASQLGKKRDVEEEDWLTIENNTGPMVAIAGTNQGGFLVRNVTEEWRERVKKPDG